MTDLMTLPVYRLAPTGPMARILRRMLTVPLVTATVGGRVVAAVGPEHVALPTLAGLLARGLVEEADATEVRSVYGLTESGRQWATDTTSKEK